MPAPQFFWYAPAARRRLMSLGYHPGRLLEQERRPGGWAWLHFEVKGGRMAVRLKGRAWEVRKFLVKPVSRASVAARALARRRA